MAGFISLYRDIREHWLWEPHRPRTKLEAWIDLIMLANYKPNKVTLGKEVIQIERGTFITSELKLMERWKWSKSKVRAFLQVLENDSMIVKKTDQKKTAITIVNYELYQDSQTEKELQKDHEKTAKKPQKDTTNKENKGNKENKNIYTAELFENIRTDIFNHWNSQNIQRHNELTDEISKTIDKTLKKYSLEDIKTAITRYGIIYHDETHFFNYKWTLTKFLSQSNALPSFLDDGDKWSNYAQKGEPTETMDDLLRRIAGEGCEIYLGPNKTYKVGVKT